MTAEPRTLIEAPRSAVPPEVPLGFSLSFMSGRGLLTTRDRQVGPLTLKILELQIPRISFPFDVTGGAERFKSRRCTLRHLVFSLDGDGLAQLLARHGSSAAGFVELKAALRDGYVELAGRFRIGESQADFTMRAALLVRSPTEIGVVFYDTRVYGWLPVPAALLSVFLRRAFEFPFISAERAGLWEVRPIEQFLLSLLPAAGWKLPDVRRVAINAAEVARGRITVAIGPDDEPDQKQVYEREPPPAAVRALDGITTFANAEEALAQGNIQRAYEILREAIDDERGGYWARERLLQIGAADPELALETRQLAEEALEKQAGEPQALLALAAIATRDRSWGEAATRFAALGELARASKDRFDTIAAELAAAEAARPIDPAGALIAYERVAARARDSVTAQHALFELSRTQGDWQRAAQAGERLTKLETDPTRLAAVHRELGQLYRAQLRDLKRARVQFERALKVRPDDPVALEGLAETYAARGEPARAASYLARLAEQAESDGDRTRIVTLNLRLGEIWERWLADAESAAARYQRVLDVDPRNRTARLRLAQLAESRGELGRARELYEDLLQMEEERGDPAAIPDLVGAYTRLARVTLSTSGSPAEAIACLERAVELDATNRVARDELARLLRERGAWPELIALLERAAELAPSVAESRHARIQAARLELEERHDARAARAHLERVLGATPDDPEALGLLLPLLEAEQDVAGLTVRLTAAAEATCEPERRAELLFALARMQRTHSDDPQRRRRTLEAVLAANPFHQQAAAELVGLYKDAGDATGLVAALDALSVAARGGRARAEALLMKAKLLWREFGRPRQAESALREAVRAEPSNERAWTTLASLLEEEGNLETARTALLAALQAARAQGTDVPALHDRLAALARAAAQPQAEVAHLVDGLRAGLRGAERIARVVELHTLLGKQGDAAALLEELAAGAPGAPGTAEMLLAAGRLHEGCGDHERAVALYRQIMRRPDAAGAEGAAALESLAVAQGDFATVAQAVARQLQLAPPESHAPLLDRLVRAHLACRDDEAAAEAAEQLLAHDELSITANRVLAMRCEQRGDLEQALKHGLTLLFEAPRAGQSRDERRDAYTHAAAVAHEVAPDELPRLEQGFVGEFPEAPQGSLSQPLGTRLAEEEKWGELLALRRKQLARSDAKPSAALLRETADLLHRRLGRSGEAVPLYQEVIAHHSDDVEARHALIEILAAQNRYGDLAGHLFAMSQMARTQEEALDYGLRSAEVYADKLGDAVSAGQVLSTLRPSVGTDASMERLAAALRRFGLVGDLAQLLETWLGASPDAEDGRFTELVALLADRLGDAPRALAWCERMVEAFPSSDVARRAHVALLARLSKPDGVVAAMQAWATAREGDAQAQVHLELAKVLRAAGRDDEAVAALQAAAAVQPGSQLVLEQLVERHTARGEWPNALKWLKQLAIATEPGVPRDARLRRLIEMATDYVDDPETQLFALKLLERRSDEETRLLAQLLVERNDADGLAELDDRLVAEFDGEMLLGAGRALAEQGELAAARRYLERALRTDQSAAVWDIAKGAWRKANALEELGRWRLQVAKVVPAEEALWLRLVAYAELVEAGDAEAAVQLEANLQSADLSRVDVAWAILAAAQTLGNHAWEKRASLALEERLDERDPRLAAVLQARIDDELRGGAAERAVEIARRLVLLGAPEAERQLERALEAAGRIDELMRLLVQRAQARIHEAPAIWLRVAGLHAGAGAWSEAATALGRVERSTRDGTWAELACRVGDEVGDRTLAAEGAELRARSAASSEERATWLRRAAAIQWWELNRPELAQPLLHEAHELVPIDADETLAAAEQSASSRDVPAARRLLEEALAVLPAASAGALWLTLAELCVEQGDEARSEDALQHAYRNLPESAILWGRVGALARHHRLASLALESLAHAFGLNADWEPVYLDALEEQEEFSQACAVVAERAAALDGVEAAVRWRRAASYARERLADLPRALDYLRRAAQADPTRENVGETFLLAAELSEHEVVASLGASYVAQLPEHSAERLAAVRAHVDALDALERVEETTPLRRELWRERVATSRDKALLGRLVRAQEPQVAACLFEEAAEDEQIDEREILLFAATQSWLATNEPDRARAALTAALAAGLDTLPAHALALDLLDGAVRLDSAARLVALGGDDEWPAQRRLALRCELALHKLQQNDVLAARASLDDARRFGHSAHWARALERVLEAEGDPEALATLWLAEAHSDDPAWRDEALFERVRRAAVFWQQTGNAAQELDALDLVLNRKVEAELCERAIELAVSLGDRERLGRYVEMQLAAAESAQVRSSLALRHAPTFVARFEDHDAAVELIRRAFVEAPSSELAQAAEEIYLAAGRADDLVRMLLAHAPRLPEDSRLALLEHIAELAIGDADDAATAFEAYRQIVAVQPMHEGARDFCVEYAVTHDRPNDAVEILERSAAAAPSAPIAFALLLRAVDLTERRLNDPQRERVLLRAAVERMPNDGRVVGRLVRVLTKLGDLDAAVEYLLDGLVDASQEIPLGIRLASALTEASRVGDAEHVRGWIASRHPDSSAAGAIRLAQARQRGDAQAVLLEITLTVDADEGLESTERLALFQEAATAALSLGDESGALDWWMKALDVEPALPDVLRRAFELCGKLSREAERTALLKCAVAQRAALEQAAKASSGRERVSWYFLLGRACAVADDYDAAVAAYREALASAGDSAPPELHETLVELHTLHGDWPRLVDLYERRAESTAGHEKAELAYRAGLIWRDRLLDESRAMAAFAQALQAEADFSPAQLACGLLLHSQQQYEKAAALLGRCVDPEDNSSDLAHLTALADSLQHAGEEGRALVCVDAILSRDERRADVLWMRAELLEKTGDEIEAESAWMDAVEARAGDVNDAVLVGIYRRLGERALARGDAPQAVEHLRRARELDRNARDVVEALQTAYERAEHWHEAGELLEERAKSESEAAAKREHLLALAALRRDKLSDLPGALVALESIAQEAGEDPVVTRALLGVVAALHDMERYLIIGERLLAQVDEAQLDATFFAQLAQAYEEAAGDVERAKHYYEKATQLDPNASEPRARLTQLAKATGDHATYATMRVLALSSETDQALRVDGYKELADLYATRLGAPKRAVEMLLAARELDATDTELMRRLADAYVLDPATHAQAGLTYRALLHQNPFDTEVLRILARLQGQAGDTEQAYLHYAALLALSPSDEEAKRFVEACRTALPPGPQRELGDGDRVLVFAQSAGTTPIEDLFVPLARFAELTQVGDLGRRGVTERDQLEATDQRLLWLRRVLDPLGVSNASAYVWRGGAYACEIELIGAPAILIGSTLLSDESERQRAFLVARMAELYRAGHVLCARLSAIELQSLTAALCLALDPQSMPAGAGPDSHAMAAVIASPMTDAVRASMGPQVQAYLRAADAVDFAAWRTAALVSAGRTAMLVACDVADAITAILRLQGFDDLTDEQRAAVIRESPEAVDLFTFALSEPFMQLRQSLGLALRRSK